MSDEKDREPEIRILFDDEEEKKTPAPEPPGEGFEAAKEVPSAPEPEGPAAPPGSFMGVVVNVVESFAFPFLGEGKIILAGGVLIILLIFVPWYIPVIGPTLTVPCLMLYCFFQVMLTAYLYKIVRISAFGDDELPDWPDFTTPWDEIFKPWLLILLALISSFGAPLTVAYFAGSSVWGITFAVLVGALYFPMQLLAIAVIDDVWALNPVMILRSIRRTQAHYAVMVLFLWSALFTSGLFIVAFFLVIPFRLVGHILVHCFMLYFMSVYSRILGKLYRYNEKTLNWLER